MASGSSSQSTSSSSNAVWSKKENKKIEEALTYYGVDAANLWEKVARAMGDTKCAEEVRRHYQLLVDDVRNIENGRIPFPKYKTQGFWTSKDKGV